MVRQDAKVRQVQLELRAKSVQVATLEQLAALEQREILVARVSLASLVTLVPLDK